MTPCPDCKGSGQRIVDEFEDGTCVLADCETCGGSGEEDDSCPECQGSGGGVERWRCPYCRGTGRRRNEQALDKEGI
jgi:DnaJ-class molecular chaperone